MLENISPGDSINITVTKRPTNTAASKTLVRILSRDKAVRTENKRLEKVRKSNYNPQMRGGRLYGGRMVKLRPVMGKLGESGTVTATVDLLADLKSVQRFISVTAV